MKRILVNHFSPLPNKVTGLTVYTWSILRELARSGKYRYVLMTNWDLDQVPSELAAAGVELLHAPCLRNELIAWLQRGFHIPSVARKLNCELVFNPYAFGAFWGKTPRVTVSHDLRRVTHPHLHSWPSRLQWNIGVPATLSQSAGLIAVSSATRADMIAAYPFLKTPIDVVHEGCPIEVPEALPPPPPETKPYALMVANITAIKNVGVLVRALSLLAKRGLLPRVCLVGRNDSADPAIAEALAEGLNLRMLGSVDEDLLTRYYAHARCYVNTSLVEGFCLPILEAQSFGAPVIASDLPVLREVSGDAASFFPPDDEKALADALEAMFENTPDPALAELAKKNAARFSWKKAARETEAVFDRVLNRV